MKTKLSAISINRNIFLSSCLLTILVLVGMGFSTVKAASTVSVAGPYTSIFMPANNLTAQSYDLTINNVPGLGNTDYFWSNQFGFMSTPPLGGAYFGLQGIDKAVFSVFDWASPEASSICNVQQANFDGGNEPGTSCIINYNVNQNHTYFLNVYRASIDANGYNWEATVKDLNTGRTTVIATINVPASWGNLTGYEINWTEYFGTPQASCPTRTQSQVTFSNFTAYSGTTYYGAPSSFSNSIAQNSCTASTSITSYYPYSFTQTIGLQNNRF